MASNSDTGSKHIYSPDGSGSGIVGTWSELWDNREIILLLAKRDFLVKYRQSLLGMSWVLLLPLITTLIFTYLVNQRVLNFADVGMPYSLFVLTNFCIWQLFSEIIISATKSLQNAGNLVTKVNFPKYIIVISSVLQPVIDFIIRAIVIVIAYLWIGYSPPGYFFIGLFFLILLMIQLAFTIGTLLSLAALVIKDINYSINIILGVLMFASPVFYIADNVSEIKTIIYLNPLTYIFNSIHSLLINGETGFSMIIIMITVVSFVFLLISVRVFVLSLPKIIEYA